MDSKNQEETRPLLGPNETVAPYEPIARIQKDPQNFNHTITCRVCQTQIDIGKKSEQYVVKCSRCKEATPIKNPPHGKKYVRCPCNCLLVCKTTSQRIICPRVHCKHVINLANPLPILPGLNQVSCYHCEQLFLFNPLQNALARCPHCRRISSVGPSFARGKGTFYLLMGFILYIILFIIYFLSQDILNHPILLIICFILFSIGTILFIRSCYFYSVKVSQVQIEA